jgi:hypothetical protein
MSSIRQIQANQQNAQLSTGPRTVEGKAAVSQNALKSGIDAKATVVCQEDPACLAALQAEYYHRWTPTTPEQRTLVDTLITNEWLLRRYRRTEAQLYQLSYPVFPKKEGAEGQCFFNSPNLDRLMRHRNAAQRNYQSALRELKLLKKEELASAEPLNSTPIVPLPPQPLAAETTSPQIGFVPQICAGPHSRVGQTLSPGNFECSTAASFSRERRSRL